jgi:hypothetical protein
MALNVAMARSTNRETASKAVQVVAAAIAILSLNGMPSCSRFPHTPMKTSATTKARTRK